MNPVLIGEKLRFYRKKLNKSAKLIANEVGITENHLLQLERGVSFASYEVLCTLVDTLEIPTEFLFEGNSNDSTIFVIHSLLKYSKNNLTPADYGAICEVVDTLVKSFTRNEHNNGQ